MSYLFLWGHVRYLKSGLGILPTLPSPELGENGWPLLCGRDDRGGPGASAPSARSKYDDQKPQHRPGSFSHWHAVGVRSSVQDDVHGLQDFGSPLKCHTWKLMVSRKIPSPVQFQFWNRGRHLTVELCPLGCFRHIKKGLSHIRGRRVTRVRRTRRSVSSSISEVQDLLTLIWCQIRKTS